MPALTEGHFQLDFAHPTSASNVMACITKKTGMKKIKHILTALALFGIFEIGFAQHDHPDLHINPRWKECSFEIDPSLTQEEWHQFTKEVGLVAYYRPLIDAKPLGKWNFEISVLQWNTKIDDHDNAWNNTFVHPDSAHYLKEGPRLGIPGLGGRIGITDKIDVGVYWTINPNANYGIYGAQVQYNFLNRPEKSWAASARLNYSSLYGPEDLDLRIYGIDLITSKEFKIYSDWISVSPYVGVSGFLSSTRETTEKVDLKNENLIGAQGMVGVTARIKFARLGVEYNISRTSTLSFKIGVGF